MPSEMYLGLINVFVFFVKHYQLIFITLAYQQNLN